MKDCFIKTTDTGTAETLRELGYKELPKEGNTWVFINNGEIQFSSDDNEKMKVNFTNKLMF